ncbi:hypothetical protein KDL01_21255 [Actinospica durhamensis]|uniref:Uncharacterized protein n=1 Tax=Actinospica durhamensis TaxID=1508375 RepID=A0A941INU8_9ACTN|nr:hypothetical protein [Actinospica durhamensis]MBR7835815.1 hypothetical protein [Actinospica durhamensis]
MTTPSAPALTTPTSAPVHGTLYLLPRTSVRGDEIIPLNLMRTRFPDLYELNIRKYAARPGIMSSLVAPLHCTWSDVVFLSPVHPAALFSASSAARDGSRRTSPKPWILDAGRLDPDRTVIRLMRHGRDGHYSDPADEHDYLPFTTAALRAVSRVTVAAIERLESLKPGDPWLPWVDVPHILHRGTIPVDWFQRSPGQPEHRIVEHAVETESRG